MGLIFKARCEDCGESIPCNCPNQKEREQADQAYNQYQLLKALKEKPNDKT